MKTQINITIAVMALLVSGYATTFAQRERTTDTVQQSQRTTQTSPRVPATSRTSANPAGAATVRLLPDLVIAEVKECTSAEAKQIPSAIAGAGCVKFLIKNQGVGDAKSTTFKARFETELRINPGSATVPPLSPGAEVWITVSDGLEHCPCEMRVVAEVDHERKVDESNENNNMVNRKLKPPPYVPAPPPPFQWSEINSEQWLKGYVRVESGPHFGGTMMYICQAMMMDNGPHPGKLYKDKCYVPWNGKEYVLDQDAHFSVLLTTDSHYSWIPFSQITPADIQKWGVEGGYVSDYKSETLYICRAKLMDGLHPGKLLLSNGTCYVAWNGKELIRTNGFDVLRKSQ